MIDINVYLLQLSINFLIKKTSGSGIKMKLFKKIIKKVYSPFIDNIRGIDIADMLLTSKFNKGFRFLFYVIDIVIALKDKKRINY